MSKAALTHIHTQSMHTGTSFRQAFGQVLKSESQKLYCSSQDDGNVSDKVNIEVKCSAFLASETYSSTFDRYSGVTTSLLLYSGTLPH